MLSFQRSYYKGERTPGTVLLGRIDHGNYLRRLKPLLGAVGEVRRHVKDADAVYAFGLDMLLLTWLALAGRRQRPAVVYEVADIRGVLIGSGLLSRGLRLLEKFLLARTDLLVVTSPAYLEGYYRGVLDADLPPTLVVENKLEVEVAGASAPTLKREGPIRIGYFGLLRCRTTVDALQQLVDRYPSRFRVILRGINFGVGEPLQRLARHPSVEDGGPFRSPDDLGAMYGGVDVVWVAQNHARANTMWSRTNRYYEACHFGKPMIAQVGTQDGGQVEERRLGLCIDMRDGMAMVERLGALDRADIERWTRNARALPPGVHTYTDEHARIIDALGFG